LRTILPSGFAIGLAACAGSGIVSLPQGVTIAPGDYVITQGSPLARHQARSRTAGATIFLLKPSGDIRIITEVPAIAGPRGIQADRQGNLVFADAFAPAIRKITPRGTIETIHEGAPLMQPKDVAADLDGGRRESSHLPSSASPRMARCPQSTVVARSSRLTGSPSRRAGTT
jgi:hypothetical protein